MKRKFYVMNDQFIPRHINGMTDRDMWQRIYPKYQSKENFQDGLAKVYQIHAHGKFTVIVRSSFIRLHVHPTTSIIPCYRLYFPSICGSYRSISRNDDLSYDRKRENTVTPTFIVHSSTTHRTLPVVMEETRSYQNLVLLSLSVIGILIIGGILWYIFVRTSHSSKSNVKLKSQHEDFDEDGYDDHSYPIDRRNRFHPNELINSLVSNHNHHNNNCVEEQSTPSNHDDKIDYRNIQQLIEDLQQSNLESINPSNIGQILSDLIHQAVNSTSDFTRFLSYASHFIHILRSIITHRYPSESSNPTRFLQHQYLIEIVHHSEFILTNLHQHHSDQNAFVMEILTRLYRILASMNNTSHRHQSICQSLSNIVEQLKT